MQENGWIKLHRSILKWEWYDDVNTKAVFLHLLLIANIEDRTWHGIELKRGSTIISYRKLAKESGVSEQEARTALEHLKATQSITQYKVGKYTVTSVNNYDNFQAVTQSSTHNQRSGNAKVTQSSNNKNNKNKKNDENCSSRGSANGRGVEDDDHDNNKQKSRFERVKEIVYGMGFQWTPEEFQKFFDFNELHGWTMSPQKAAPKWDYNMKHPKSGSGTSSNAGSADESMDAYLSLVNKFDDE